MEEFSYKLFETKIVRELGSQINKQNLLLPEIFFLTQSAIVSRFFILKDYDSANLMIIKSEAVTPADSTADNYCLKKTPEQNR